MSLFQSQVAYLRRHSVFSDRWLIANPNWLEWLALWGELPLERGGILALLPEAIAAASNPNTAETEFMAHMRLARQRFMIWLAFRDLNQLASLAEVTVALSFFAEQVIALAVLRARLDLQTRFGLPWSHDLNCELPLMVVGMGKLGGYELNVSSDIDLIFLYEQDGNTQGGISSLSNHEWFDRAGKRVIKLLAEQNANGFVFRVDMRLRPNGDSGPLVCSLDMLEEYLTVQGREWERYAWIKGRLVYPPSTASNFERCNKALTQIVRPFIYRGHLDYGVIAALRELHAQIQREAERRSISRSGLPTRVQDIKLGRGGIREIEFLAQMFQLMRGGTDPRFQIRPTLEVLSLIAQQNLLPQAEIDNLAQAYQFLRRLEHRLQIWEDQQTHSLPEDEAIQLRLAETMTSSEGGTPNPMLRADFLLQLERHQNNVARLFDKAFALDKNTRLNVDTLLPTWEPDVNRFPESLRRWQLWLASAKQKALPESSRLILVNLLKKAVDLLMTETLEPEEADRVLLRFCDLLEAIARRGAYLAILAEYPQALINIFALLKSSEWGATYLTRHPHLLDNLLDSSAEEKLVHEPALYWREVKANLDLRLDDALIDATTDEQAMNVLRVCHQTETFLILLADLGIGTQEPLGVEKISDRLSALADMILQVSYERVWAGVAKKFSLLSNPLPPFAVIAYGKLGGKELGYASDLDLVFIYAAEEDDLKAQEIYTLLAKRMINWLTAFTSAGTLFEIDTRLRPNGSAGFLVTSIAAFRQYQFREGKNVAWVWEHQALTRARFAAGQIQLAPEFDQIRSAVLGQIRDPNLLRQEILAMRLKVHEGHPNATNQFDLKHDAGGMVDIEFIVQYLVLAFAHFHPQLIANLGNIALLSIAADCQLIERPAALAVGDAYRLFRAKQHRLRLDGVDKSRLDLQLHPEFAAARLQVIALWKTILQPNVAQEVRAHDAE